MTGRVFCLFGLCLGLLAACGVKVTQYGIDYMGPDAGVSSSSSSSSGSGGNSSGTVGTSGDDAGVQDASADAPIELDAATKDAGPSVASAKIVVVNAAAGLGPFRLCFGAIAETGFAVVGSAPPLPDRPGWSGGPATPPSTNGGVVPVGAPGVYPGTAQAVSWLGISPQGQQIQPFVIDATAIASDVDYDGGAGNGPDGGVEETCVALLGSHGNGTGDFPTAGRLQAYVDFWPLPTEPPGKFANESTYLLALTGCPPGYEVSAASAQEGITAQGTCGLGYSVTNGNLAFLIEPLDTTTTVSGLGLQFVNLSPGLANDALELGGLTHAAATQGVRPGTMSGDGTFTPLVPGSFTRLMAAAPTAVVSVPPASDGGVGATGLGVVTVPGSDDGGVPSLLAYPGEPDPTSSALVPGDLVGLSLASIEAESNWQASMSGGPASFVNGQTFTLILLGTNDPAVPQIVDPALDGDPNAFDGRGLHLIAYPNRFTPPTEP